MIFMGRLTKEPPNDIRVFGRAIGIKYQPGRDDATPADIAKRTWKEEFSRYIRVHRAEFVSGTLANGISLNQIMQEMGSDCFATTQRNAARGSGNTNPRHAYSQQAAVALSATGLDWLGLQLQQAFETHGKVPQDFLDQLDWPDPLPFALGPPEAPPSFP